MKKYLKKYKRAVRQSTQFLLKKYRPRAIASRHFMHVVEREPELGFLAELCWEGSVAVDVGVLWGAVTNRLSEVCGEVWAFEANPEQVVFLLSCGWKNVNIENVALSDSKSTGVLRIPQIIGHATVESHNKLLNEKIIKELNVDRAALDSYELVDVGFIKIDVEGHEFSVLKGSINTLKRCKPNIIVECNDRYNGRETELIINYLCRIGYKVIVFKDKKFRMTEGILDIQKRESDNVVFIHEEKISKVLERLPYEIT